MKIQNVAKTGIGLLLARLRGLTIENPRQAERRAEYLKKVRKLVRTKKGRKV